MLGSGVSSSALSLMSLRTTDPRRLGGRPNVGLASGLTCHAALISLTILAERFLTQLYSRGGGLIG